MIKITPTHINELMDKVTYYVHLIPETTTTQATAFLDGFSLAVGTSACVDPSTFNKEIGESMALEDAESKAKDKLWELEGYALKFHSLKLKEL